jgi:cytochrome c oxidase subunit 2
VVVVGGAVLAGCVSTSSPNSLDPAGSDARSVSALWWVLLWIATAVFVIVAGLILFGAFGRRRANPGRWSDHRFITLGGIAVPFVILAVVGVMTVLVARDISARPSDPLRVEVIGHRWWWEVRYPDTGFVSANELRVPTGRPVAVTLRSVDVIHSLWIPQVAGKLDAIPGQPNHMTFDLDRTGRFTGLCAEYCGIQHANMAIALIGMHPADFAAWMDDHARERSSGATSAGSATRGEQTFMQEACSGCHTIAGTPAQGTLGPALTDIGARPLLGAGALPNTPENLRRWIADTQGVKDGALMPTLDLPADEVDDLVAYLTSLR